MTNSNSINTFKKMTSEYIVTVNKEVDLEEFYNDMETPGGSSTIPDREVVCYDRRVISRNTGYLLTDEEVDTLKNDSRVLDVISNELLNSVAIRPAWVQSSNDWDKGFAIQNTDKNWGLYRCINGSQVANWGSNGTSSISGIVSTTTAGQNVDVVIVDGHLNPLHPEFAVNVNGTGGSRVVQYNWYQHTNELGLGANGNYVYPTGSDLFNSDDNHGMHVAGTACGNTQGWARGANIYNISPYFSNPNTLINSINGFNVFDYIRIWHNQKPINPTTGRKNPTILNNSWGLYREVPRSSITSINYRGVLYSAPFTDSQLINYGIVDFDVTNVYAAAYIPAINADIEDAVDAGIIFVGSAMNDSTKIDVEGGSDYNNYILSGLFSYYYHRGTSIASASRVGTGSQRLSICVGAISSLIDESKATFSNCGPRVDIYAPGVNIISSLHDGTVRGGTIVTVTDSRNSSYVLGKYQGTSMASPQVCGVLACLLETYPNLNQDSALQYLKQNSSKNVIPNSNGSYLDFTSLQNGNNLYLKYSSVFLNPSVDLNPSISGNNKPFGARNINLIGGDYIPNITSDNDLNINANNVGISSNLIVAKDTTSEKYYGDGVNLVGIVTQIIPGIGVDIFGTQDAYGLGKGAVKIDAYRPIGKTIYVSQNGNDDNTGLTENHTKRTIKAASAVALYGDTIQVFPGVYVEENPIILTKTVSVNGTELRNCVVTPKYPDQDLFYVNNGCHINNLSFIGQNSTNGAAVVALQPLKGTAADRFFDASRLIRLNLDYISRESVGFLTSGFSGFAGNHREQDAARLIDLNIDYIAAETVGFLTSTAYQNPPFTVVDANGDPTDVVNCSDDIKDILRSISYDLKANSNRKSVGAGLTYYDNADALQYITAPGVKDATIAAINHAVGIATYVINNYTYPTSYTTLSQDFSYSPVVVSGGCTETVNKINTLASYVTDILDTGPSAAPTIQYGVKLEPELCAKDVKNIWKGICFDITRGGNSKCVGAGLSYYDKDGNLIPQILANPGEVDQTIATLDYSFNVARSVVNNCTWGGYPVGLGTTVVTAVYGKETGITTITATNHGLFKDDAVKIQGLEFTCPGGSGITTTIFPNGKFGYVFPVKTVIDENTFEFVGGISTITHDYASGGTIQKYSNFQNDFTQVKDLGIQTDIETGFNDSINSCQNVISALRSCVGVVTTIVGLGTTSGINITYPGNSGIGFTTVAEITSAIYDEKSGRTSITAPTLSVKSGDIVEVRDLTFSCTSGGASSTQIFPSGKTGYEFYVDKVYPDGSFNINVGVSTLVHNYEYGGFIVNRSVDVADAIYDNVTGITTITAPGSYVRTGDLVELRNLTFSCSSGGAPSTQIFPSGKSGGFIFKVLDIVTDRPVGITSAVYDNVTGITTITAPNFTIEPGGYVELRDLLFSCSSGGAPSTQIFPSGKSGGFKFKVLDTVGLGNTFTVNVGVSTLAHNYEYGGIAINKTSITNNQFTVNVGVSTLAHNYVPDTGVILPPYSKGVGPITQGPYIRNCTNFIPDSIGMKVDGFEAEPGDADDIGVTGTMSVDSYTQYNQGGIGVSITNGGYAQLVSIFTICDDIAIYTGSGGQCDLTNSNSSFGNYGLYSNGVGDAGTKSLYRYTGKTVGTSVIEDDVVLVSGLGNYRPYDGQAIYFDTLYYTVQTIVVDDPGSGYSANNAPRVDVEFPQGPSGIRAEASPNVIDGKVVSIDVIASGNQYLTAPKITIAPPPGPGTQATAHSTIYPIYYNLESASLPVNGTSRIVLTSRLNNTIPEGSTVYFSRLSLQIATTISFEWVGAGTNINTAKPALGGITLKDNEVVKLNGGQVVFTSTNQAGNFRIGEGVTVNQLTGTITGRSFSQSLLNTVTPLIIALSK